MSDRRVAAIVSGKLQAQVAVYFQQRNFPAQRGAERHVAGIRG